MNAMCWFGRGSVVTDGWYGSVGMGYRYGNRVWRIVWVARDVDKSCCKVEAVGVSEVMGLELEPVEFSAAYVE